MRRDLTALLAGIIFGTGLAVSGMVYPLKVLGFLDVAGHWDPSLALVMLGAIAVTMPAFHWLVKLDRPLFDSRFYWPQKTDLDLRLLTGAALFGIGWGIAGYCPGPALAALAIVWHEAVPLLLAAAVGGWFAGYIFR